MSSIIQLFRSSKNPKQQFDQLLAPHIEVMYRMAFHWTRSQEDAEDLVQDVLMRLADKVEDMLEVADLRPWLIKVVFRRFVDLYRQKKNTPFVDIHELEPNDNGDDMSLLDRFTASNNEEEQLQWQQILLQALETLDEDQRDVTYLHFIEGYTALEAAEILDINVGTIKSRLQRARTKLKNFILSGPF